VVINDEILKLRSILNFVAHNGYFSCFFCYVRGIHRGGKQQYPYKELVDIRTLRRFAQDSLTASRLQRKEKGHVGVSVTASIMDTQLPHSIIIDYPHSSLLRHAKAMFKELYKSLRPSDPTEIRNILFYDFVPVFHRLLPPVVLSHFALFICGLRLLHGRATFGNENAKIADELITRYYKDFSNYYNGLENLQFIHLTRHRKRGDNNEAADVSSKVINIIEGVLTEY
ncbi:unnamed protein product, partial [Rotaria magnacalcarata]